MLSRILSLLLGIFYIVSGLGKLLDVYVFSSYMFAYGVPYPYNGYAAVLVPPLEILLGLGLIFFVRNKQFAIASVVAIIIFTIGFAYSHFARGVQGCGCFGVFSGLATSPLFSFIRNGVILVASLFLVFRPSVTKQNGFRQWQKIVLLFIGAISFAASGISSNEALYSPEPLLHKHIKETPISKYVQTNSDSTYLVFCMALACPHCWNATENVKAFHTTGKVDKIVAFGFGNDSLLAEYKKKFSPNFPIKLLQYEALEEIIGDKDVPTVFLVRQDTITNVMHLNIPSPWSVWFEKRKKH